MIHWGSLSGYSEEEEGADGAEAHHRVPRSGVSNVLEHGAPRGHEALGVEAQSEQTLHLSGGYAERGGTRETTDHRLRYKVNEEPFN